MTYQRSLSEECHMWLLYCLNAGWEAQSEEDSLAPLTYGEDAWYEEYGFHPQRFIYSTLYMTYDTGFDITLPDGRVIEVSVTEKGETPR